MQIGILIRNILYRPTGSGNAANGNYEKVLREAGTNMIIIKTRQAQVNFL